MHLRSSRLRQVSKSVVKYTPDKSERFSSTFLTLMSIKHDNKKIYKVDKLKMFKQI